MGLFDRLKERLKKTREVLSDGLTGLFRGGRPIDPATLDDARKVDAMPSDLAPYVAGAKVTATVQEHGKGDKVVIVKFRRRKHYKREKTHRQPYTEIKVTGITGA